MVSAIRQVSNPVDAAALMGDVLKDAALSSFTAATINNAAGQNLTTAQVLGGMILRSGAVAVTDTLPTAAELIAAMGTPPDNTSRLLVIRNANTGTLTLGTAAGTTITGTATIATVTTAVYVVQKTSSTTVVLTRLLAVAY